MTDAPKTVLLVGLGNPLMGDEGIGWHIVERLKENPRLPAHVEAVAGGTDLLRFASLMEKCRHVILVDALLDERWPARIEFVQGSFADLDSRQGHAHSLSALQTIELLQLLTPALSSVCFTLALVGIASASVGTELSGPLAAALPGIVDTILGKCPPPPAFQTCGACKWAWPTWESFVLDPAVRMLGFQAVIANPDLNLLVFEHRCGSSISILARRLRHMLPHEDGEPPSATLFGTKQCHGHCRFLADLEMCDSPCLNAHDRKLILLVHEMKKDACRS
jgi:hydrogenase maturation protease